jgi:hypothetical protein
MLSATKSLQLWHLTSTCKKVHLIQPYVINVWEWLFLERLFSPSFLVSLTNKTDHHDITEIVMIEAISETIILIILEILKIV